MAELRGYKIHLSKKRAVFLGRKSGSPHYFIEFINGQTVKRFCLSEEAMEALLVLKEHDVLPLEGQNVVAIEPIVYVIEDNSRPRHWQWQVVKELDA